MLYVEEGGKEGEKEVYKQIVKYHDQSVEALINFNEKINVVTWKNHWQGVSSRQSDQKTFFGGGKT